MRMLRAAAPLFAALLTLLAPSALVQSVLVNAAHAQAQAQPARPPIVLVIDAGTARISAARIQRALATALARDVVRITDDAATRAAGTLTIAFSAPNRWVVRYESGGTAVTITQRVTRPGTLTATLTRAATDAITQLEAAPREAPPPRAERRRSRDPYIITLADEIIDPFDGLPPPTHRAIHVFSEVIDPFEPAHRRDWTIWTEVLDPWVPQAHR
jgi:hypothetical protein